MHLPKLKQIRNKKTSKRNTTRSTKCTYVLNTERKQRQAKSRQYEWQKTNGNEHRRQRNLLHQRQLVMAHPRDPREPVRIASHSERELFRMTIFFWVQSVATQPLRVRGHYEWVSRMLVTIMGAIMERCPSPLGTCSERKILEQCGLFIDSRRHPQQLGLKQ